jgi:hypothetical protein
MIRNYKMSDLEKALRINSLLVNIRANLEELEAEGKDLPAVEKNAKRMLGTLSALEAQFAPLAELS